MTARFGRPRRSFAVALAILLGGCTVPEPVLEGRACPCLQGYVCVLGRCWSPDASTPATSDASTEACEFMAERPCGTDEGECTAGTQACTFEGTWGDCEGSVGPAGFDECDGKDNDCNGKTDENSAGACEKFLGVCAAARRDCVGGRAEQSCPASRYGLEYEEVETACDGKDNDCDGETDEGLVGSACEKTRGVCAGAVRRCVGGGFPPTCAAADYGQDYEAAEATCDGKDNDCDGETDEAIPPMGGCELQQGLCEGSLRACVAGAFEALCTGQSYPAGYHASDTCDGLDDDCDGVTDDGFTCAKGSLLGVCETTCHSSGISRCNESCNGSDCVPPPEACNGLDDDCDSSTDEFLNSGFLQLNPASQSALPAIAGFGPPGAGFATAWVETGGSGELKIELVAPEPIGSPSPGQVNAVAGATTSKAPAIAGSFVGWIQPGKVRAAPLGADGVPGAAFDLADSTDASGLVAAALGGETFFAWSSAGKAWQAAVTSATQLQVASLSDMGVTAPALGAASATQMVLFAESAGGLVAADLSGGAPSLSKFADSPALQPSAATGAVVYTVPGTCGPCPPGHSSGSRIVVASFAVGSLPEAGVTAYVTDNDVYATHPKIAALGGDFYVVAYRMLDAAGKATLGVSRLRLGSSWTVVTGMTLSRPGTIASAALAFDGSHAGLVLDESEVGVFHALYRTSCP